MRLAQTAFSFFLMLLPLAAGAVDLNLSAEGVTGYDDNVFRGRGDRTDDLVFRLTPTVKLSSQDSKMVWALQYRPTYEILVRHTDGNELTHDVWGRFDYAFDDKTKISFFDQYRRLYVLNYPSDDGVDDESNVVPDDDIRREAIDMNDGSFSLSHIFSPKWSGQTSASYRLFYTDRKNANHSKSFAGSQSFQRALNAANDLGFGASVTVQMWEGFEFQPGSDTFFYNLFGSWVHRFGESTTLSVRAGPALVHTDQEDVHLTRLEPKYPHTVVPPSVTTVGDLRKKYEFVQGYVDTTIAPPPNPYDMVYPLPPDNTPVPLGSVLVPDARICGYNYNALTDRCAFRYIVPNIPGSLAPVISDPSNVRPVTLLNSDEGAGGYAVDVFGEVQLTHRWTPTLASTLLYNRSEGAAAAQGSSSIADMVTFLTTWKPTELWDLSIRGTYLRRKSPTQIRQEALYLGINPPFPFPELYEDAAGMGRFGFLKANRAIYTQRWSVWARAARRVTRRTTMTLRLGYVNQQTRRSDRNPDTFNNFSAFFGVRYDFDPIRF